MAETGGQRPAMLRLCASGHGTSPAGKPAHHEFLAAMDCDVLLLTEVSERLELPGYVGHLTAAEMAPRRRWAGVFSRGDLVALPDPHPASAMARVGDLTFCSSILPWRGCASDATWGGGNHAAKTQRSVASLLETLPASHLVWGGDFNHALEGREYAGSIGGRRSVIAALETLGLAVPTARLPHQIDPILSIDHIAVPESWTATSADRISARTEDGAALGPRRLCRRGRRLIEVGAGPSRRSAAPGPRVGRWTVRAVASSHVDAASPRSSPRGGPVRPRTARQRRPQAVRRRSRRLDLLEMCSARDLLGPAEQSVSVHLPNVSSWSAAQPPSVVRGRATPGLNNPRSARARPEVRTRRRLPATRLCSVRRDGHGGRPTVRAAGTIPSAHRPGRFAHGVPVFGRSRWGVLGSARPAEVGPTARTPRNTRRNRMPRNDRRDA